MQFKRLAPAITLTSGSVELLENLSNALIRECSADNVIVIAPESKDEEVATPAQKETIHATIRYLNEYEFDTYSVISYPGFVRILEGCGN